MMINPYLTLEEQNRKKAEEYQALLDAAKVKEAEFKKDRDIATTIAGASDALAGIGSFGSIMLGRGPQKGNALGRVEAMYGDAPNESERLQKLLDSYRGDSQALQMKGIDRGLQLEDEKSKRTYDAQNKASDRAFELQKLGITNAAKVESDRIAKDKESRKVSQSTLDEIAELDKTIKDITELKNKVKDVSGSIGPIAGRTPTFDQEVMDFESKLAKTGQNFAKAIEGGKLTDSDRAFYQQEVTPSVTDRPDVVSARLNTMLEDAKSKRDAKLNTLSAFGTDLPMQYSQSGLDKQQPEVREKIIDGKIVKYKKVPGGWERI